jgi:formamidopyrimidine-DNA glycosylase
MPELPEVETSLRGIRPHILEKTITQMRIYHPKLRWDILPELPSLLSGRKINAITRRGKYLLLHFANGYMVIHLGMSGNLRITGIQDPLLKHDHVEWEFDDGTILRFNDQRRFGAVLWTQTPEQLSLLSILGPEPLTEDFNAAYLFNRLKNRSGPIKSVIMENPLVVGVGNIYANESLFLSGIHPLKPAKTLALNECHLLVDAIKNVLEKAIQQGGTTLRDFVNADGKPGYFQQTLNVYGRKNQTCHRCHSRIEHVKVGQRATFFCPNCQN